MDTAAASAPQLKTPAEDRNTKQVQLDGFERLASCQPGVKEKTRDSEHEKEVMKCRLSAYFFYLFFYLFHLKTGFSHQYLMLVP